MHPRKGKTQDLTLFLHENEVLVKPEQDLPDGSKPGDILDDLESFSNSRLGK